MVSKETKEFRERKELKAFLVLLVLPDPLDQQALEEKGVGKDFRVHPVLGELMGLPDHLAYRYIWRLINNQIL